MEVEGEDGEAEENDDDDVDDAKDDELSMLAEDIFLVSVL